MIDFEDGGDRLQLDKFSQAKIRINVVEAKKFYIEIKVHFGSKICFLQVK